MRETSVISREARSTGRQVNAMGERLSRLEGRPEPPVASRPGGPNSSSPVHARPLTVRGDACPPECLPPEVPPRPEDPPPPS